MGRGNVCVNGKYEGLFYIDNDDIHVYRRDDEYAEEPETRLMGELDYAELTGGDWIYDEEGTGCEEDDVLECLMDDFTKMFPSFDRAGSDKWLGNSVRVIMESRLFYVGIEDNEWSVAVKLLQKEEPWGLPWMENLQGRFYQKYLDGLKTCLLARLPSIGTYGGAWTSGRLTREEVMASER